MNDHFVELTKAYKALTDEEIRNNYIQYGHPDGKQSFSIGIALPKFIVTEGNGKYVLLVYGLLLGVLLPYVVGKWWYGTQRYTKEKVLVASAGNIFREYKDDLVGGGIISALSSGEEYKQMLKDENAESGLAKVEKKILSDDDSTAPGTSLTPKDRKLLADLENASRRKALALLWAYLGRVELDDPNLNEGKFSIFPQLFLMLNDSNHFLCREIWSRPHRVYPQRFFFVYCACFRQPTANPWVIPHVTIPHPGHSPWWFTSSSIASFYAADRSVDRRRAFEEPHVNFTIYGTS